MSCYPLSPEQNPHPPRKGIILRRMFLCASIAPGVYGVVRLTGYGADLFSSRQTARELRKISFGKKSYSARVGKTIDLGGKPEKTPRNAAAS